MIFNFNFVTISSMSGFEQWGEFSDMKKMIAKLEELRKNNEIHAYNCSVLMTGFVRSKTGTTKKIATYNLMYLDNHWVMVLPQ